MTALKPSSILLSSTDSARTMMEGVVRNEIQIEDVPEVIYMQCLKKESQTQLDIAVFDTQRERDLAECIQKNINCLIDTTVNCLNIAAHLGRIGKHVMRKVKMCRFSNSSYGICAR